MESARGTTKTRVISFAGAGDLKRVVDEASRIILSGGLVAYPTESLYGLAVDATNEKAIERVFSVKKRSLASPILILVSSLEMLGLYVDQIPPIAHELIREFWPGGLTMVFNAGPAVEPLLNSGTGKIAVRLSSHPLATELVRTVGVPITGTSANISGRSACRNAKEVLRCFENEIDLIIDGGESPGMTGSTILDVTVQPPQLLREGIVHRSRLKFSSI